MHANKQSIVLNGEPQQHTQNTEHPTEPRRNIEGEGYYCFCTGNMRSRKKGERERNEREEEVA